MTDEHEPPTPPPIDPAQLEAELERPLAAAIRDAVDLVAPPPDFADRVLAARDRSSSVAPTSAPARAPWRRGRIALAAAAALALTVVALRDPVGEPVGEARPQARASILLGGRGVARAEAGAHLRWRVARGRAEIEQTEGTVFYRVERGGPFVVHTPAGTVEVRGTCFSVEVGDMKIGKQGIIGAGVGAALATSVLVAVYEGKVSFANEHGQVALSAGERGSSTSDRSPRVIAGAAVVTATPEASASTLPHDELVQRAEAQQLEIAALRRTVQALQGGGGGPGGGSSAGSRDGTSYLHPTKEDLQQLAQHCRLAWDEPRIGQNPAALSPERAAEMGLSETEREAMNKVNADFNAKVTSELRQLYVELTGDTAGAEGLSPQSMIEEIEEKTPRAEVQAAFQRLSRERAGQLGAPADPRAEPVIARLMRLRTSFGDRYERELGAAIGPDLARKLREERDGWGSKHGSSYGCPDGK